MIHGILEGFAYGFSQSIIFLGYIIAFRFGAFLVALPPDHLLHESFSDIFRVMFALLFGAMAAGQASAFAPDYTKAKLSANRIFAMLDREPVIDNYSKDGQKLVCFNFKHACTCLCGHWSLLPFVGELGWICQRKQHHI